MSAAILVIEDDRRSVDLITLILKSRGYVTVVARDGREGLDAARSRQFDAILLDLMLPEVDGLEVLRQLQADAELADVPVIITSARARPAAQHEALSLGADVYLTKPYRKAELLDAIEALLKPSGRTP